MVPEHMTFETAFTVMPDQCNNQLPMIFGGALFSQMDLCAAMCSARALQDSECDSAVTHKCDLTFLAAAMLGDIVFLKATIIEFRKKAIVMWVEARRERRNKKGSDLIAQAKFVFVSKKNGEFVHHGLEMPKT
jgi:acyl-CoA hydrolase